MTAARTLIGRHRHLAIALVVLAFCIKAVVPAGFMVSNSVDTVLTISTCSDNNGALKTMDVVIPSKDGGNGHSDEAKPSHCAFAGLGQLAIGGADAILLAIAVVFILVRGLAPARHLPFRRIPYLQPPLRGPPAAA